MAGLKVVDDKTFTVTLTAPFAQYPVTVGYNGVLPAARGVLRRTPRPSARSRSATARSRPTRSSSRVRASPLTRYEDYAGDNAAHADSVEFRVYTDINTAYTDAQGGNLDVLNNIPPDAIATAPDDVR